MKLRRGVNLSHWFSQTRLPDYPPLAATDADMAQIAALGMDHVRLPVDPAFLADFAADEPLKAEPLARLDEAIRSSLAHGLRAVVDMHPRPEFKTRLETDPEFFDRFVRFWEALARHLRRYDHRSVALELLNEPMVKDPARWQTMAEALHAAARRGAPRHMVVLCGGEWSDTAMLRRFHPLPDPNTVYTFHFYEPHAFTHQGARWGLPEWKLFKGLDYPLGRAAADRLGAALDDASAREALTNHFNEAWTAEKIARKIGEAAEWAASNRVTLWCGEFGVFRDHAPDAGRVRYIGDVRTALEANGIGWAFWDYHGSFALLERKKQPGEAATLPPDRAVAEALGLRPGR